MVRYDLVTLSRLLDEALDMDAAQVPDWLAALPPAHAHLAPQLREMLRAHALPQQAGFMLDGPKLGDEPADAAVAHAGELVGPYRLIRELGRGGMGAVWLAERADGSFERQVALKLPRLAWDAGLAERMVRERQIGARLEHPNIARLYDAGVDEAGRPYLAHEYIDGVAIDIWCRDQALSLRRRLGLVVQLTRAVSHAHARLVVHRDLKPSNVLVTADGQAHLLDFGIASFLHDAAAGNAALTMNLGRVFTPQYASPEQLRGDIITVQSDVYSLGVLAYELLSGETPYALKRQTMGALEDAILNGGLPPASKRTCDKALGKALRGDLDAILDKALRLELDQRYASADAFGNDIERFIEGRAVKAQPDSLRYRLGKAVRRHRLAVAAGGLIALTIAGGAAASALQARRANAEAERTRVVKEFLIEIFKVNERGSPVSNDLRAVPAELLLERGARLIESRFGGQVDLQADLYGVVAQILLDMGASRTGVHYAVKHIEALEAARASASARSRGQSLVGEMLTDMGRQADAEQRAATAVLLAKDDAALRVRARLLLATVLLKTSRPSEALTALDKVEADFLLPAAAAAEPVARAQTTFLRASAFAGLGRSAQAQPLYRLAIEQADAAGGAGGAGSRLASRIRVELAESLVIALDDTEIDRIRAEGVASVPRAAEAEQLHKVAFAALRASGGVDAVEGAASEARAAWLYLVNGMISYDDADAAYAKSLATLDSIAARLPGLIRAKILFYRGCTAQYHGKVDVGYRLMSDSMALRRAETPGWEAGGCLGFGAMETGRHEEAERILARVTTKEARDPAAAQAMNILGLVRNRLMQGSLDSARAALDAAPARFRRVDGTQRNEVDALAFTVTQGWVDLEQQAYRAVVQRLRGLPDRRYELKADRGLVLGAAECALGNHRAGLAMMEASIRYHGGIFFAHSPALAYWRARAGLCALDAGQREQSLAWARQARAAIVAQPVVSPFFKAPLMQLEKRLGLKVAAV